jgi:hypothetical protein
MDQTGEFTPDNLEAGPYPQKRDTVTVPSGTGVVKRGTILDASGVPVANAAEPDSIALDTVDATNADRVCVIGLTGEYNINAVVTGSGTTPAAQKAALRDKGIFLITPAP